MIGVEIAVDCLRAVSVSLLGGVLWSTEVPLKRTEPVHVCQQEARLASQAQVELKRMKIMLSGVGIGLPGAFDEASGMVSFASNLGWRNVAFMPLMLHALRACGLPDVPVHVQNEADTAALSEYEFASDESDSALIFVTCDVGVGAGIVLNDRLFTGAQGMGGRNWPQHSATRRPTVLVWPQGLRRDLHRLAGIGAGAQAILQRSACRAIAGYLDSKPVDHVQPGRFGGGGSSCVKHPELLRIAQDTLKAYSTCVGMAAPLIRPARYGELAAAVGAAALVMHQHLRPMHTRAVRIAVRP
jgi:ROK family